MKLTYQQAIVSLCLDLTNPEAVSSPVAVLLVARTGRARIAAFASRHLKDSDYDPITREVLADVPHLLERHLNAAFSQGEDLDAVLRKLHGALRNSLHVSEILPAMTVSREVRRPEDFFPDVVKVVGKTIARLEGVPVRARTGSRHSVRGSAPVAALPFAKGSTMSVWNPPQPIPAVHA
jgi:hypothetical protein